MALESAPAMADLAIHNNTLFPRGEMATGETAAIDGAKTHEVGKAAHKESTQVDTEVSQQKTTANHGTPSLDTAIGDLVVNPLRTSEPAPTVISSTSNAATIARDAVMNIPELLECIISFLPRRDIFSTAQRISWTWIGCAAAGITR